MKYFYILLCSLVGLFGLYSLAGIGFLKWSTYQTANPKAAFQVIENGSNEITIVDFTNYRCGYCKTMHPIIQEMLAIQENIRYVPRPIFFREGGEDDGQKQEPIALEKIAIAAGIQGKFVEMHNMFMEYPDGIIPEDIIKETADLYGIDYAKMIKDSQGKLVEKYLNDNVADMLGYKIETLPSYIINGNIYEVSETLPTLQQMLNAVEGEK